MCSFSFDRAAASAFAAAATVTTAANVVAGAAAENVCINARILSRDLVIKEIRVLEELQNMTRL